METRNEKKEILNGIYSQISSFDNKAGLLVSVLGIVFGLSLDFFEVFSRCSFLRLENSFVKILCYMAFGLYCISFLFSIISFVLVIIPRTHKIIHKNNVNYYKDICNMNPEEFNNNIKDYCENDTIINNQIFVNSRICNKKHLFLKAGIYGLIPFGVSMLFFIIVHSLVFVWMTIFVQSLSDLFILILFWL